MRLKKFILGCLLLSLALIIYEGEKNRDLRNKFNMLYSVVEIGTGIGAGVVIFSGDGQSLILTVRHLLNAEKNVSVTFYPRFETYSAEVVKVGEEVDLALLRVWTEHDFVAKRVRSYILPKVFDNVYKIGSGLTLRPFPTYGIIEHFSADVEIFHVSAQGIYGDSGGGVFNDNYQLIGIVVRVGITHGSILPQAVPHVLKSYNQYAISAFLKEE